MYVSSGHDDVQQVMLRAGLKEERLIIDNGALDTVKICKLNIISIFLIQLN